MPLPMSNSVPTLMEQKTNRDTAKRQVSAHFLMPRPNAKGIRR